MIGMDRFTGKRISGLEHLRQSVGDILSTPIGTRIGRRDYGSLLFELIDQPMNGAGQIRIFAAVALALARWEPRLALTRVGIERGAEIGAYSITLEGKRTDVPAPNAAVRLTVPIAKSGLPIFA